MSSDLEKIKLFFKRYPEIDSNEEVKNLLLENDYIRHNIVRNMCMSSGQKQLIALANKKDNDVVNNDELCFLDQKNLKLAKKVIKLKKLK